MRSGIYTGLVVHQRHRPRAHRLRYRVFSLLLDLDELPALSKLRLFGHNRRAPLSFREADHGDGRATGLKDWVQEELARAGLPRAARVSILCYPRLWGYVFNPLTEYFCHDAAGQLIAVLHEVTNTFHERHVYVIPAQGDGPLRHSAPKRMYVSPFLPMDCRYDFRIHPPEDRVLVAIDESDCDGPILYAAFSGRRAEISDATLLRALAAHPLMTLKVTAAIHWEALRLWIKGVPVFRHTPGPALSVTTEVQPDGRSD